MALPEIIDFSPELLVDAAQAQVTLARTGQLRGDYLLTDGLVASGVEAELVTQIATEIVMTPNVRDRIYQSPFTTGFAVGRSVVKLANEAKI